MSSSIGFPDCFDPQAVLVSNSTVIDRLDAARPSLAAARFGEFSSFKIYNKSSELLPPIRAEVTKRSIEPSVRCALCAHALQVSAFTETVECSKTEKLKNADLLRCCSFFEPA